MKRGSRRLVLAVALVAASVVAACLYAARGWIEDRYYLFQLSRAAPGERSRYIEVLLDRGCAAVTPHLLRYFHGKPIDGSLGMTMAAHNGRVDKLVLLGPGAIPYLAEAIDTGDVDHWEVFDALMEHGPKAAPAVPALARYLAQRSGDHLGTAIELLGSIGKEAAPAVPVLLAFRRDKDDFVRWDLYLSLGRIGPAARDAVPLLLDAIRFEAGEWLVRASVALERIEPGRREPLDGLLKALADESQYGREYSADALPDLGSRAREALPELIRLLRREPEAGVIAAVARALDRLDPDAGLKEALLLDPDKRAIALGGFSSRAGEVVPVLLEMIGDGADRNTAENAMGSLGRLGAGAAPAIPRLIQICRSSGPEQRVRQAATALGEIGVPSPPVVETLLALLPDIVNDGNHKVAGAVARLVEKATDPRPVIEMLLRALQGDRPTRRGALTACAWIGPPAAEALPAIRAIAADASDRDLMNEARYALRNVTSRVWKRS